MAVPARSGIREIVEHSRLRHRATASRRIAASRLLGMGASTPKTSLKTISERSLLDQGVERAVRYVSDTEAKQALAAVLDAAQREPVVIRRQQREVAVILSVLEYQRLTALNVEEFQRFCERIGEQAASRGLAEEKLTEILAGESWHYS